jgi:aquaporin SIP
LINALSLASFRNPPADREKETVVLLRQTAAGTPLSVSLPRDDTNTNHRPTQTTTTTMVSTRSADVKKGGTPAKGKAGGKSPAGGGKTAAAKAAAAAKPAAAPKPKPISAAALRAARQWRVLLAGDFVVTAAWVFVSCLFSHAASALIRLADESDAAAALVARTAALWDGAAEPAAQALARLATDELVVTLAVLCLAIVAFGPLCALFGGALFNPVHNVAFWVAGRHTAAANAARMLAQVAGGVAGASAAVRFLPEWVSPALPGGLKPGVSLGLGCAVEFVLGAALNAVVLFAADTRSALAAFAAPVLATVALGVAGAAYTGPSLNPAAALAWYLQFGDAHPLEHHVLAFWGAPVAGAVAGGLLYRYAIAPLTGARKAAAGGRGGGGRAAAKKAAAPARRQSAAAAVTPARSTRAAAASKKK